MANKREAFAPQISDITQEGVLKYMTVHSHLSTKWSKSLIIFMLFLGACGSAPSVDTVAEAEQPVLLVSGKEVYMTNCASCHGPEGEGQPNWKIPDANGVRPAPPHDSSGHTWHHSDSQLLDIIANGSPSPGSTMIGYKDILTQAEMEASLTYIKTFWGEQELQYQADVTKQSLK